MEKYNIVFEETWLDYPSPNDNAIIVYMTGCEHHCKECHSPVLQIVRKYSQPVNEIINTLREYAKRAETNKIVLCGGDPLHPANLNLTENILDSLSSEFDICIFTGYTIDIVKQLHLKGVKYYKCGKFDIEQYQKSGKTDEKYILASKNQNFYDKNYVQISENGILLFNNN